MDRKIENLVVHPCQVTVLCSWDYLFHQDKTKERAFVFLKAYPLSKRVVDFGSNLSFFFKYTFFLKKGVHIFRNS